MGDDRERPPVKLGPDGEHYVFNDDYPNYCWCCTGIYWYLISLYDIWFLGEDPNNYRN